MKHMLIIESDKKLASKSISGLDCTFECYTDNKMALKRIMKNHFDIIIIDSDIPIKNNIDIGKLLRMAVLSGKPVIVINHLNRISNYFNILDVIFGKTKNAINTNVRYLFNPSKLIKSIIELLLVKPINPNHICRVLLDNI